MKLELMESILNKALKIISGKSRQKALSKKLGTQLDDIQKSKGITPGKITGSDVKKLMADEKYNKINRRYTSVGYPELPAFKSKYLTGKK